MFKLVVRALLFPCIVLDYVFLRLKNGFISGRRVMEPRTRKGALSSVFKCIACLVFISFMYYQITFPVRYLFKHVSTRSTCILPKLDPFDDSIMSFVWHPKPLVCQNTPSVIFVDDDGLLQFNQTALKVFNLNSSNLVCKYSILQRLDDISVKFSEEVQFKQPTSVNADFFRVICSNTYTSSVVFDKILTNIYTNKKNNAIPFNSEKYGSDYFNIFLFGIDSVSRSAAIRKLPLTYKYLKDELHAYEFEGYMKVGENTLPNIVPLLTGKRVWTPEVPIKDYAKEYYDSFPFIWKNFSDASYVTLFAEDLPEIGVFNYVTKGFKSPPTHHYMRPFWLGIEAVNKVKSAIRPVLLFLEEKKMLLQASSTLCYDNTPKHLVQINYVKQFIKRYKNRPKFMFSFLTEIAHEYPNFLEYGDTDFRDFLIWLKTEGLLQNSVLAFFSDHGARIDKIRNTFVGRIEDRMPYVTLVIPDFLKRRYSHLDANLLRNTKRLTTPFDMYETLVNILHNDYENKDFSTALELPRGISLFHPIPERRSCADAWIPEHYCACYTATHINKTDNPVIQHLAEFVVSEVNALLSNYKHLCALLTLKKILEVNEIELGLQHTGTENSGISIFNFFRPESAHGARYLIVLETIPGNAVLEATAETYAKFRYRLVGDVSRANKYGNQSDCIQDKRLKLYCYCL
ncbi:hypothetical protein CHS0354_026315 [Potamilus streckersoni]|uniref:Uncharacterized protein n=1 Tax=Potamilus streckersoni TaxID=2493646 RepID=A0AAE0TAY5_9BIVA|nr:hypothetical protein CHS0354_026315 [Potamilus streckersoni]